MANDYGLCCPECGQDDKFEIVAPHVIDLADGDLDHRPDDLLEWGDNDKITCGECGHVGTVADFEEE
ncbi:MAG: hypothetical protein WKG03_03660 [Telluria sp.]